MTVLDTTISSEVSTSLKDSTQNSIDILLDQENSLEIVQELRQSGDWEEVEAYQHLSDSAKEHSLTASTLRAKNLIERRPLKFYNKDKTLCTMIFHLGENLCGHDGIIHGGLAATILDEMLAYVTIPSLPNLTGFTANLDVNYRRPIYSKQWVVVRGELDKIEGRKAWGKARIEALDGQILTEATALYISPRVPPGPPINF